MEAKDTVSFGERKMAKTAEVRQVEASQTDSFPPKLRLFGDDGTAGEAVFGQPGDYELPNLAEVKPSVTPESVDLGAKSIQFDREALLAAIPKQGEIDRLLCRRNAPNRPPSWRWQRAAWLCHNEKQPSRHVDDQHVADALRMIKALTCCKCEIHVEHLCERAPNWWEAYSLALDRNEPRTLEIEARLLARQPAGEISSCTGVPVEAIDRYGAWFFDVADRLEMTSWIVSHAIGKQYHTGFEASDVATLWKTYGYFAGASVLDELIYDFRLPQPSEAPLDAAEFFHRDIVSVLKRRAAVAVRTLDTSDPKVALRFLKMWMRYEMFCARRQRTTKKETGSEAHYRQAMDHICESLSTTFPGAPENLERQYQECLHRLAADTPETARAGTEAMSQGRAMTTSWPLYEGEAV